MKLTTLVMNLIFISALTIPALALDQSEIPTVVPSVFTDIKVNKLANTNGGLDVEIFGSVRYGNGCMVSDHKTKKVSLVNGQLHYQVYSGKNDGMACPKIYRPITKNYLIDRFSINDNSIPKIFVNEKQVY